MYVHSNGPLTTLGPPYLWEFRYQNAGTPFPLSTMQSHTEQILKADKKTPHKPSNIIPKNSNDSPATELVQLLALWLKALMALASPLMPKNWNQSCTFSVVGTIGP